MKINNFLVVASFVSIVTLSVYVIQSKKTVTFDNSMRLAEFPDILNKNSAYPQLYEAFKRLYEKNHVSSVSAHAPYKIPKIIHQIWLGSPFPEKYKALRDTWLQYNPDWEYRLWTEKEIDDFGLINREMYDFAVNYGERSDIARYEILHRIGGVYVDTDYECYKPFDMLHQAYDFYIGIQPLDTGHVQLGIGIIGSRPGHPLLKQAIHEIGKKRKTAEPVVLRTGPFFFTLIFHRMAPTCSDAVIALPSSFLYPMGYYEKVEEKTKWVKSESYANHLWGGSWLSDDAFVK